MVGANPVTFNVISQGSDPVFSVNNLQPGTCAPLTFTFTAYNPVTCVTMSDYGTANWPSAAGPVTSNSIAVTAICATNTFTQTPT